MFLRSGKRLCRQMGVLNGLLYIAHRALSFASNGRAGVVRYLLVAQPVSAIPGEGIRVSTTTKVREVDPSDPIVSAFPRPASVIARRFEQGATCFASECRGRFSGYLWLAFGSYDEDEVRCRYEFASPHESAWDFDVYVAPEFRSGRTFARLWSAANQELDARGVRWSFSRVSPFNQASVAAHLRLGIRTLHTATFLKLGRLQIALISARPFVHVGISEHSRPVVVLSPPTA